MTSGTYPGESPHSVLLILPFSLILLLNLLLQSVLLLDILILCHILLKVSEYWLVVCMFFLPQGGGCRGYRLTAHHVKVKVSVVAEKGPTLAAGGSVY